MLEPSEKQAFDSLVGRLTADDPAFVALVHEIDRKPRPGWRQMLSVLLWTTAPLWIIFGGWTGLILAVVAVAYAAILTGNQPADALPRGSVPRPGAEI